MLDYVMYSLSELLNKHAKHRKYEGLYAFLKDRDPEANAYVGQIENRTRIPARKRIESWAGMLSLTRAQTDELLNAAEIDRVYAAAKRNKTLGVGLNLILKELDLVRAQAAEANEKLRKLGLG